MAPERRAYCIAVSVAAAGFGVVAWAFLEWTQRSADVPWTALLASALFVSWLSPLAAIDEDELVTFQADELFLPAALAVLTPADVVIATAIATFAGALASSTPWAVIQRPFPRPHKIGFAVGNNALGVLAGAAVAASAGPDLHDRLAAALAGTFVYALVVTVPIDVILGVLTGRSFVETSRRSLPRWSAVALAGLTLGAPISYVAMSDPAVGAVLIVAVSFGLAVAARGLSGALVARGHLEGLLDAARAVNEFVSLLDVERALCAETRRALRCENAAIVDAPPWRDVLSAPMSGAGGRRRWLVASGRRGSMRAFGSRDKALLQGIASVGEVALRNATLVAEMEEQATRDQLTQLFNRRRLEEAFVELSARARRDGGVVGVLFIDLDGFKAVNDSLGHDTGDRLLRDVADRLRATMRDTDAVARLGGDEFVVTVLAEDEGTVHTMATRLAAVLAEPYDCARHLPVGASVGTAIATDLALDAALVEADRDMYAVKRTRATAR